MNPQDDPEARIRALEPTEFSAEQPYSTGYAATPPPPTQQWPYQSPYGQTPYGADPYAAAPQPPRSNFRPLLVIVPAVLLFLALAGGAAAYFIYSNTSVPGVPGISGGGGVLTDEPDARSLPSLPDLPTIIQIPTETAAPPSGSVPESGSTITISGIGAHKTVACNDSIIIISGANNTVDITGHCIAVTVSGFENIVTAESTQEIAVSGFDNKITYRSGTPQVSESGSRNSITQG